MTQTFAQSIDNEKRETGVRKWKHQGPNNSRHSAIEKNLFVPTKRSMHHANSAKKRMTKMMPCMLTIDEPIDQ